MAKSQKLALVTDEDWEDLNLRAVTMFRFCLADEVLYNILGDANL